MGNGLRRRRFVVKRALLASALALGCVTPLTEVMVVLDTDLAAGVDVDTVRIVVSREGSAAAPSHDVVYDLRSGRFRVPGTLGVVARDPEDRTPLRVTVTASRNDRPVLTTVATGAPRAYELARLDVFLARRCLVAANATCPEGSTCGRSGCEPIAKDPLPLYNPALPP